MHFDSREISRLGHDGLTNILDFACPSCDWQIDLVNRIIQQTSRISVSTSVKPSSFTCDTTDEDLKLHTQFPRT